MSNIDNINKYCELLLIYGKCLTPKQYSNMKDYYFSDFSLSEIAENQKVSRNAIHLSIKQAEEELDNFEQKLHFAEFIRKMKMELSTIQEEYKDDNLYKKIEEIKKEIDNGI